MSNATKRPSEPWNAFFQDLEAVLAEPVRLHCLGGFVVTEYYGMSRETSDVDYLIVEPKPQPDLLT